MTRSRTLSCIAFSRARPIANYDQLALCQHLRPHDTLCQHLRPHDTLCQHLRPHDTLAVENCDEWQECIDCDTGEAVSWDPIEGAIVDYPDFDAFLLDRLNDAVENL